MKKVCGMKLLNFFEKRREREKLNEDIIRLLNCPANGNECTQHLAEINRLLSTARQSRLSKEYNRSIHHMEEALIFADRVQADRCLNCANLFRKTILTSMENVKDELEGMSKGFFKGRYIKPYQYVSRLIREREHLQQSDIA